MPKNEKGNRMPQVRGKLAALAAAALLVAAVQVQAQGEGVETLKKLQAERVALIKKLTPSVVAVADKRPDLSNPGATGMAQGGAQACSGFVVDNDYVVTNFESRETTNLEPGMDCWLMAHDGTEFGGKVVGKDKRNLVLVIKMNDGHPALPSLKFANSDKVEMGATAISLGNTLDSMLIDRQVNASYGTVSGFYRFEPLDVLDPFDTKNEGKGGDAYRGNVFEIDCAVHPGDHGGPVCNLDGEVIGMMTPHWMAGRHLGTAVTSNQLAAVYPQLKKGVKQDDLAQATLGFKAKKPRGEDESNIYISEVTPGGPAEKAGLKVGQRLLRVDNYRIPNMSRLAEMLGTRYIEREMNIGASGPFGRAQKRMVPVSYGMPVGTHVLLTIAEADGSKERTVTLISVQKEDDF